MLENANRIFVAFILFLAASCMLLSLFVLFIPDILGKDLALQATTSMNRSNDFILSSSSMIEQSPHDSPYYVNFTVDTPYLESLDQLHVEVYGDGRLLADLDCLEEYSSYADYNTLTRFDCPAALPYDYSSSQDYEVYATLQGEDYEFVSGPIDIHTDWGSYEINFWSISLFLFTGVGAGYLLIVLPIVIAIAYVASRMKHPDAWPGEYTIASLLNPFSNGKTLLQRFNSFLVSPYFWAIEAAGIFIILLYMFIFAAAWKSGTALVAFILSGLIAFLIPFLWCAAFWYADFREREPLRILVTFFLWGVLSGLMAIGINSVSGLVFSVLGLGFLSAFLIAPPVEEFFKGSGLALLAEHHEYNSVEDGLVFGFVIGMGFSFIENWIYLLGNPMGSDIFSWFFLFILRCIMFSSIHGLFTAMTGGVIGYLKERNFAAPAFGLIPGFMLAAFFHAMHNSGQTLAYVLGIGGLLTYCCILIPMFDYGGFFILLVIFIWALVRKK